jgi:predicted RecA/RadA family phage recombinase
VNDARQTGDLESDFGRYVLGAAAIGELGPIILVAMALSHEHDIRYLHQMLLSMVFLATAIEALFFARSLRSERLSRMIARWMGDSSVLPVRISILILLGFISFANKLGMEMVLGAYTAGMMIAMLTKVEILQYRLTSIGSGFFIPLFFITSGVEFDLPALVTSPASLARLILFCGGFLFIRFVRSLFLDPDWPYLLMLAVALFGAAYTSADRPTMMLYWMVLGPMFGIICVVAHWRDYDDPEAHWELVRKQALHWTAVMFTMALVFAANVKQMMNADASALMVLALLALGTFTAGIQTDSWRAFVWSGSYSVLAFPLSLGSKNQHYSSYWWPSTLPLVVAVTYLGVRTGDMLPENVGGFFGVANYDAEQTLPVEITLGGVWQLPKAATVTFAVGAAVYFDATAGNVTSVSTRGNKLIGAATQCAGASDAVAIVRLNGVSV